jgi:hypothetical protein
MVHPTKMVPNPSNRWDRSKMLPLMTLSAHHFSWTKTGVGALRGVAEESDMPEHHTSAVFTDCSDYGFFVVGKHETRLYIRQHILDTRDNEGEIVARVYVDPEHSGDQIHLLND